MSLSIEDVRQVAKLSKLELSPEQEERALKDLNSIFDMIETMRKVDTQGVEPLFHPHELPCRLREDVVTEPNMREEFLKRAPLSEDGLFMVPKVIE